MYSGFIAAVTVALCCGTPGLAQRMASTEIAGGRGGNNFSDLQAPAGARIIDVRIRSGDAIDAVRMVNALANGRTVMSPWHGGMGGNEHSFRLDRDEYIIGLSGRYGDTVDSLQIYTNQRVSQLYGGRGGDRDFRIDVPTGSQAIGFAGRSGDLLDAAGLTYTRTLFRR